MLGRLNKLLSIGKALGEKYMDHICSQKLLAILGLDSLSYMPSSIIGTVSTSPNKTNTNFGLYDSYIGSERMQRIKQISRLCDILASSKFHEEK